VIGARPDTIGLDRSLILGFVQISVFVVGLGFMCVGGYITMVALWRKQTLSIAAEIGERLVATGFLVAVFAGMADISAWAVTCRLPCPILGSGSRLG